MQPVRRDLDFDLSHQLQPEDIGRWHSGGRLVAHFFNALSLFFPEGERFFIHSVRHYRGQITDPALQNQVAGFIGQEAMHGREHIAYNDLIEQAGLPARRLDGIVHRLLERLKQRMSPAYQLAVTLALEHFTAMLAHLVLTEPRVLGNSDARMSALWRWHALEETEHKAVAYDVYQQVLGRGLRAWFRRCTALVIITSVFLCMVLVFHLSLIRADKQARGLRHWGALVNFLFGAPGVLRRLILPWLDYFRPSFHPWDHDNRDLLVQVEPLSTAYAANR